MAYPSLQEMLLAFKAEEVKTKRKMSDAEENAKQKEEETIIKIKEDEENADPISFTLPNSQGSYIVLTSTTLEDAVGTSSYPIIENYHSSTSSVFYVDCSNLGTASSTYDNTFLGNVA